MRNICLYFQIHQPIRLKKYRFFDIGQDHYYFDDFNTEERMRVLVEQSYLSANRTIAEMIRSSNGKFRCAFSISGIALEQLEQYFPEVIDSFKELTKTGSVEFLGETYAHSLASVYDANEFENQIKLHSDKIEALFGQRPKAFRNTELIYSDEIGELVSKAGFKTILIEEAKHILGWKSPNYLYNHAHISKLKVLVRNNALSDDITYRFSNPSWSEFPLTADKFIKVISELQSDEKIINIWMGYETLGLFQQSHTGIFEFLKAIPYHAMEHSFSFMLPSEVSKKHESAGPLAVPYPISWAGNEKDISNWNGNDLQQEALSKLYAVGERVRLCNDKALQHDWLVLQSSDHFKYMSHKDSYGTNYETPYEAFTNYMNILADFLERVDSQYPTTIGNEELNALLKTIKQQDKEIERLELEMTKLRKRKTKEVS